MPQPRIDVAIQQLRHLAAHALKVGEGDLQAFSQLPPAVLGNTELTEAIAGLDLECAVSFRACRMVQQLRGNNHVHLGGHLALEFVDEVGKSTSSLHWDSPKKTGTQFPNGDASPWGLLAKRAWMRQSVRLHVDSRATFAECSARPGSCLWVKPSSLRPLDALKKGGGAFAPPPNYAAFCSFMRRVNRTSAQSIPSTLGTKTFTER